MSTVLLQGIPLLRYRAEYGRGIQEISEDRVKVVDKWHAKVRGQRPCMSREGCFAPFRAGNGALLQFSSLARDSVSRDSVTHDLGGKYSQMAGTSGGAQAGTPLGGHSAGCFPKHGVRERAGGHRDASRDTRPSRVTRHVETTLGVLSYAEVAPLLAERVQRLEENSGVQPRSPTIPVPDQHCASATLTRLVHFQSPFQRSCVRQTRSSE